MFCKWWVAVDGLVCSSCRLAGLSPSAFLPVCNLLARLFKSGADTAFFRLLRLLLLLLSFIRSFVRKSSNRDLMEFWTVLFRAHNPPASFIFHRTRLLEVVSNTNCRAQHLSSWESVSWWTAILQFWRSLKEMEMGLNSPQNYWCTSMWKGVNQWGRYTKKSANEGKPENTSPFSDSVQHSPMLTALLSRILETRNVCLPVCYYPF